MVAYSLVDDARDAGENASTAVGTDQTFRPGECVSDLQGNLPVVSCEEPHEGEVYAVFTLPSGPWPGRESVKAQAGSRCGGELGGYASDPHAPARLRYVYLFPNEDMWATDRSVICIAKDPAGPMIGSLKD